MAELQHIAFNCFDLKRQESFYTKHFGFRRSRVFNAGTPEEFVMLRLGAMCLELFSAPGVAGNVCGGEQIVGFKHLAFEVSDLEAAISRLQADGIETGEVINCSNIVEGLRICFFNDPEGNRVELMQGYKDEVGE